MCFKSEKGFGQYVQKFFGFWAFFASSFGSSFASKIWNGVLKLFGSKISNLKPKFEPAKNLSPKNPSSKQASKNQIYQAFLGFGKILFYSVFLSLVFVGVFAINLPETAYNSFPINLLPTAITKPSSNFFHAMRTFASIEVLKNNPDKFWLGYGLGISGPAAKMSYYNIKEQALFRDNEAVAYRYRLVGEDLTIPENWYIQTVFNGGIFYAILYLVLASYPVWQISEKTNKGTISGYEKPIFKGLEYSSFNSKLAITGFAGSLLGNLFLHIFESSTVFAYFGMIAMLVLAMQKYKNLL
jgi:hypothetical protein